MHQHDVTLRADCDDEAAAFWLSFTPTPQSPARVVRVSDHVTVDLTVDGQLLGVELRGPARDALLRSGLQVERPHV